MVGFAPVTVPRRRRTEGCHSLVTFLHQIRLSRNYALRSGQRRSSVGQLVFSEGYDGYGRSGSPTGKQATLVRRQYFTSSRISSPTSVGKPGLACVCTSAAKNNSARAQTHLYTGPFFSSLHFRRT